MKKAKEVLNNKGGFSLVELIVVIVIMLVLAAVMVPNVMKYIGMAGEASTKNDAASMLTQVQAEVAEAVANMYQGVSGAKIDDVTLNNVTAEFIEKESDFNKYTGAGSGKAAQFTVDSKHQVSKFSYQDGNHFINWTANGGWEPVGPVDAAPTTNP